MGGHIEFYLPEFVSWKANDLVLSVGGATSSGGDGPMNPLSTADRRSVAKYVLGIKRGQSEGGAIWDSAM